MDSASTYAAPLTGAAVWFERAPDAMAVVGFDGRIRHVNAATVDASGYSRAELIGSPIQRFFHPEDQALIEASVQVMSQGAPGLVLELRSIDPHGAVRWFEWNAAPLDHESFIAIGRDISTRRAMSHTLEDAGAAMAGLSQGYWIRDVPSNTIYWSRELRDVFRLGPEEQPCALEDVCSLIHPDDRERVQSEVDAVMKAPNLHQFATEYRLQTRDGTRMVRVSVRIARDGAGRPMRTVGTAQDITEQRLVEQRLACEERLNRAVFESNGALIMVIDRQGRVVRLNRAAEHLTGFPSQEIEGKPFWEQLIPAEERQNALKAFERLLHGAAPSVSSSHWFTRDWRRVPTTWSTTAIKDDTGQVEYIIATGVDISGLTEVRKQLAAAREDYQRLIELIFEMVLVHSVDGVILDINQAGAQMFGVESPEQIIGRNLNDFIHPESTRGALECAERTVEKGDHLPDAEIKLLTLDGRVLDVEMTASIRVEWQGAPAVQVVIRDITERRLAQTAARAREHYFETLAQVVNVGMLQTDAAGFVVYANRRTSEIVGSADVYGEDWQRFVHPDDLPQVHSVLAAAVPCGRPITAEWRFVHVDGRELWVLYQAVAQRGEQGEVLGYIGTLTDITPFKLLTGQLLEAEDRARRVVAMSFDLILIVRADLTIAEINVRGARMLGCRPKEFVDQPFLELILAKQRGAEASRVRRALESGQPGTVAERRLLKCDGSYQDMEGAVIPVTYDGEPAVYVVYRDISERKAAERALRQREHHFQTLAKAAPVGIFQTDAERLCIYVNERYLEITGYSYVDTLGQGWRDHVVEEDRERVEQAWCGLVENDARFQCEYRLRRKDGQVIWVLGQAVSELDKEGELLGFIGSITDITRGKLNELELRNYREHLEDMVRERTLELEAVNRELESFSYSVSHDLRAPLRAIHGFVTTLADEYEHMFDEDARFFLRRIQVNSRQMSDLIEDLLELSKVSQAPLKREWIDLSEMAVGIIDELRLAAPDREVETSVVTDLRAFGDPKLLRSLMHNLLGNAWKYTGKTDGARIEFGALDAGGTRTFYVRDNGVGFDMAAANELFRAFQRLHHPSEFEGTGIGLATVHRIVTRHGGRVWAEATEGVGATFFFTLH